MLDMVYFVQYGVAGTGSPGATDLKVA